MTDLVVEAICSMIVWLSGTGCKLSGCDLELEGGLLATTD